MERYMRIGRTVLLVALATILLLVMGCSVGPKYVRPPVEIPSAYKETPHAAAMGSEFWKTTQPKDDTNRGNWWKVYNDPQLNELEAKASSASQEVAAAADRFLAARALVREARSQYFPSVSTNPSILNSRPSQAQFGGLRAGSSSTIGLTVKSYTAYSLPFDASWEPDFWGRIRSPVRANIYAAQASAADLENVRLRSRHVCISPRGCSATCAARALAESGIASCLAYSPTAPTGAVIAARAISERIAEAAAPGRWHTLETSKRVILVASTIGLRWKNSRDLGSGPNKSGANASPSHRLESFLRTLRMSCRSRPQRGKQACRDRRDGESNS
jgi:hypothetical protein